MTPTETFRSEYGRLCSLSAQAIRTFAFNRHAVYTASIGKSKAGDPWLKAINAQHGRLDKAIRDCHKAGITTKELIPTAKEVQATVEAEWYVSLPLVEPSRS